MKKSAAKSYALRIDAQLVKPLQELKKQNRRSLNAEINAALENWLVHSRVAETPHTEAAAMPPPPPPVNASKAKRKPTRRRAAVRAEAGAAAPGAG